MSHFMTLVLVPTKVTSQEHAEKMVEHLLRPYDENGGGSNPKWDWWQIGGRWTGALDPDYDAALDPRNTESCDLCGGTGTRMDKIVQGKCNKCDGKGEALKWPTEWASHPQGNYRPLSEISDLVRPPYAVVTKDGWFERGQMGWFGISSNEKELTAWEAEWKQLREKYSGYHAIVVDCHI